jgi:hypothetical protein
MATARMSIGSIFGAIGQTAGTITTTLEAANAGLGMANEAISNMAIQQKLRSKADNASFKITLANEKTQELAESTLEAAKFRQQSDAHAQAFDSAYAIIAAALEAK